MLAPQPVAQLGNRRLRPACHLGRNRRMQMHQQADDRWLLWSWRIRPVAAPPLPRLDNIQHADTEPRRYLPGAAFRRQYTLAQVLRVGLSTPPPHRALRFHPGDLRITNQTRAETPNRDSTLGDTALNGERPPLRSDRSERPDGCRPAPAASSQICPPWVGRQRVFDQA